MTPPHQPAEAPLDDIPRGELRFLTMLGPVSETIPMVAILSIQMSYRGRIGWKEAVDQVLEIYHLEHPAIEINLETIMQIPNEYWRRSGLEKVPCLTNSLN